MMTQFYNQKLKKRNGPSAAVLKYDAEEGKAPQVVAQGTGEAATKILAMAKEHGVQVQEDEQLLGELLNIDLGDQVPPQLYSVIAEILLLLEEIDQ